MKVIGQVLLNWQHYGNSQDGQKAGPWVDCEFIAVNHRSARVLYEVDGGMREMTVPLKYVLAKGIGAGDTSKFSDHLVQAGLWNGDLNDMRPRDPIPTLDIDVADLGEDIGATWPDFQLSTDTDGIMPGTFTLPAEPYTVGYVTMPFKPMNTAGMMLLLAMENSPEVRIKKLIDRFEQKIQGAAEHGQSKVRVGPFDMFDHDLVGDLNGACDKLMGDGFLIMIHRINAREAENENPECELEVRWDKDSIYTAVLEYNRGARSCMQPWTS
jgi:hypothetical protein